MEYQQDRAWMEISLDAIVHNFHEIQRKIGPDCIQMAVVKANAYGLGAVPIARELEANGCEMFSVACIEEAMELRENGVRSRIFILGPLNPIHTALAIERNIEIPLVSLEQAQRISRAAVQAGGSIVGHLKVDVGLSRFGIVIDGNMDQAVAEALAICKLPGIEVRALCTHFTTAVLPEGEAMNRRQIELFRDFCRSMNQQGVQAETHCASSQVAIYYPECNDNYIRSASLVLGLQSPMAGYEAAFDMQFSVQLKTRVWQLKEIGVGVPVSYGPTYRTKRPTCIAVIPLGFADGLRRSIANSRYFLLHGKKAPIIGKLCMDYTILDVTDIPGVAEGDLVTVFGRDENAAVSVCEFAEWYPGTVGEVTAILSPRIPRFYLRAGKIVARSYSSSI